jgi:hypothetical protein
MVSLPLLITGPLQVHTPLPWNSGLAFLALWNCKPMSTFVWFPRIAQA